jgi:hypothetical protein
MDIGVQFFMDILLLIQIVIGDEAIRLNTAKITKSGIQNLMRERTITHPRGRLADDFSQKDRLALSLQPPEVVETDCPVAEGGGYTGFEHNFVDYSRTQI